MSNKGLKTFTLEEITDKHIGQPGTPRREAFENELRIDLLGEAIKQARLDRKLTQEELGKLVGVQKAQISKLENTNKTKYSKLAILKLWVRLEATRCACDRFLEYCI